MSNRGLIVVVSVSPNLDARRLERIERARPCAGSTPAPASSERSPPLSSFSFSFNFPVPPRVRHSTCTSTPRVPRARAANRTCCPPARAGAGTSLHSVEPKACVKSSLLCRNACRLFSSLLSSSFHYHYQFPRGSPAIRVNC